MKQLLEMGFFYAKYTIRNWLLYSLIRPALLFWVFWLFILHAMGCSEIFETDITQQIVTLLLPADSLASRKVAQTFKWLPLEGAREYRLEVGSPSLADPSNYYMDTITARTNLRLIVVAGRFEWRVRALNAGYSTGAVSRTFRIDSSANLSEQSFLLVAPPKGTISGTNTITFRWEALPMAERYVVTIPELSTADTTTLNSFTKVLPRETRNYNWLVTALNATSRKAADEVFTFSIDLSAPSAPQLVQPQDNAQLTSLPITFTWQRTSENIVQDSLFLYSANQTILSGFPRAVQGTSLRLDRTMVNLGQGTYYWGVRSTQSNGRTSSLSEKRRFSILQ